MEVVWDQQKKLWSKYQHFAAFFPFGKLLKTFKTRFYLRSWLITLYGVDAEKASGKWYSYYTVTLVHILIEYNSGMPHEASSHHTFLRVAL